MVATTRRHPLPGSERSVLLDAHMLKAADPQERIAVTVLLRRRTTNRELPALLEALSAQSIRTRHYMSRDQFDLAHVSDTEDLERIEAFTSD